MGALEVRLFGKFSILRDGKPLDTLSVGKAQEALCYLLLHREHVHSRESLADLLWSDCSASQSRKYLRQVLWQIQAALHADMLIVESDWVSLNAKADLWIDVSLFERAVADAQGVPGPHLSDDTAQALQQAAELYQGDLLESWYQDWCLFERERLQNMYLALLDKLMEYCESLQDYEAGLAYGTRILCLDRARERTHRVAMRLLYLAGDRTSALRQYQRCVAALHEELDVEPAKSTRVLYEQIRADEFDAQRTTPVEVVPSGVTATLTSVLTHLEGIRKALVSVERQVQQDIQEVEAVVQRER
jgi:DNA-binding SARP family transcriptional activator